MQMMRGRDILLSMKLFIASDHAGFFLKEYLRKYFITKKISVIDLGASSFVQEDDYPRYAFTLAKNIGKEKNSRGILLCGSGQGVCIAANKISGVRAALAWNTKSAILSRKDDDANILCLPSRLISRNEAKKIVDVWLRTPFSKEARHIRRIKKLSL